MRLPFKVVLIPVDRQQRQLSHGAWTFVHVGIPGRHGDSMLIGSEGGGTDSFSTCERRELVWSGGTNSFGAGERGGRVWMSGAFSAVRQGFWMAVAGATSAGACLGVAAATGWSLSCPIFSESMVTCSVTTSPLSSFSFSFTMHLFFLLEQFGADVAFLRKGVHEALLRRLMRKVNRASFAETILNVAVYLETSRRVHFTSDP